MSDCKKCGNCCRYLIIEITGLDLVREPKLKKHVRLLKGQRGLLSLDQLYSLQLYSLNGTTCPMLKKDKCSIYATRPNVCREFKAGCDKCKMVRGNNDKK